MKVIEQKGKLSYEGADHNLLFQFLPEIYCMNYVALVDHFRPFRFFPNKEMPPNNFLAAPPFLVSYYSDFTSVNSFRAMSLYNDLFDGCLLKCRFISNVLVFIRLFHYTELDSRGFSHFFFLYLFS